MVNPDRPTAASLTRAGERRCSIESDPEVTAVVHDHGEGRGRAAGAAGDLGAELDGREPRLDGVRGPQVDPVLGGVIVEREQLRASWLIPPIGSCAIHAPAAHLRDRAPRSAAGAGDRTAATERDAEAGLPLWGLWWWFLHPNDMSGVSPRHLTSHSCKIDRCPYR